MDVVDAIHGRRTVRSFATRSLDRMPPAPHEPPRPEIVWRAD